MEIRSYTNRPTRSPARPMLDGLAIQSAKDECDINKIISKYQKTGLVQHVAIHGPTYGDYDALDFQTAMETIASGTEMFQELPSSVRKRFGNDPARFMEFINDPDTKLEDLERYGLTRPRAPETAPGAPTLAPGAENASDGA